MMGDVEQFARRQPGLFFGGAFLLGLIGARFLKSSGDNATTGRRSMYSSGDSAGRDDYKDLRPYESTQSGYSNQYPPVETSQYGSSGRGSSTPYVQRGTPSSGQQDYRSGESSAAQSSVPTTTSGNRTGEI